MLLVIYSASYRRAGSGRRNSGAMLGYFWILRHSSGCRQKNKLCDVSKATACLFACDTCLIVRTRSLSNQRLQNATQLRHSRYGFIKWVAIRCLLTCRVNSQLYRSIRVTVLALFHFIKTYYCTQKPTMHLFSLTWPLKVMNWPTMVIADTEFL